MRITRQVRYAVYGVFDLAYNGEDRPVAVQEIAHRQRVPARYLEQILQRLRRAGLVESKRGPGGGYVLASSPSEITLADIVAAVEGSVLEAAEAGPDVDERPDFIWLLMETTVGKVLGGINLAEVCREAAQRGVPRADTEPAMYHI
jgi:Rrf2 family protein